MRRKRCRPPPRGPAVRSRRLRSNDYLWVVMGPSVGILDVLYAIFMIVLAVPAVYAVLLSIVFLRRHIAELKRAVQPVDDPH